MSRAYREMVERYPHLYGVEGFSEQQQQQMEAEYLAFLEDEEAQREYDSWLAQIRESSHEVGR